MGIISIFFNRRKRDYQHFYRRKKEKQIKIEKEMYSYIHIFLKSQNIMLMLYTTSKYINTI